MNVHFHSLLENVIASSLEDILTAIESIRNRAFKNNSSCQILWNYLPCDNTPFADKKQLSCLHTSCQHCFILPF